MKPPREVMGWDDYFLHLARSIAVRSKDPDTQVGCVIADKRRHVVSTGYNGPPPGVDDMAIDWSRPAKYETVIHSEANAILHARGPLEGCALYVTGRPCSSCMRLMAASAIREVHWTPMPIRMLDEAEWALSQRIAAMSSIVLVEHPHEVGGTTEDGLA